MILYIAGLLPFILLGIGVALIWKSRDRYRNPYHAASGKKTSVSRSLLAFVVDTLTVLVVVPGILYLVSENLTGQAQKDFNPWIVSLIFIALYYYICNSFGYTLGSRLFGMSYGRAPIAAKTRGRR